MRNIIGGQIGYDNLIDKKLNFLKKKRNICKWKISFIFHFKKNKKKNY